MTYKNTIREQWPLPEDLRVFITVIRKQSFAGAADELGVSPAYISKRIQVLETTLQTKLLHRSTRRLALTDDGEKARLWATRLLGDLNDFVDDLSLSKLTPRGHIYITSTFGFGRNHVAPAVSDLAEKYPELDIRLEVSDKSVDLVSEGFDLEIRIGNDLPEQHICKKLVSNKRIICASPKYISKYGEPKNIDELTHHNCLVIKERNNPFGVWVVNSNDEQKTIKINGSLSSNNGEIVLQWALHGRGLILRSLWDVKPFLEDGSLVQVLTEYSQDANVWAIYPTRLSNSAKLRVCVEFLEENFKKLSI
ncbi:LysR substrate-binding domain-containing protein [Marinomonas shanghaiensis]|uniref:LysR substrate-binding domain-containing protein n=1 Tax=Marinomonas shanghaiensis TaxID=2202418 RepID=UPI003A8F8504